MTSALLAVALAASAAPPPDAAALARKVQAFYEKTRDLEAGFVQTYTYAAVGRSQVSRGTLRVKKPGKLRWDYASPTKKTIVVNGSRLTQYEPEEEQVYVDEHFDATAMSAAVTFLLGKGSLEKEFELGSDGPDRLVLTPRKPDARVARVVLTVGEAGEVTGTKVVDGSDNVNDVAFEHIRRNPGLKDDVFVLDLPKDVHRVKAPGQ
jgi:outer membrane lipoprotein carrier protein